MAQRKGAERGKEASRFVGRPVEPWASWPAAKLRAYEKGLVDAGEMLAKTGGTLSLQQVAGRLGVSRQTVAKKVKRGELFTVPGPSKRRCYPAIQFDSSGAIVPGLKDVISALPTANPYFVLNFLASPNDLSGDRPPIELLAAGDLKPVIRAAKMFHEQGA